jgi:hypothetical protein
MNYALGEPRKLMAAHAPVVAVVRATTGTAPEGECRSLGAPGQNDLGRGQPGAEP